MIDSKSYFNNKYILDNDITSGIFYNSPFASTNNKMTINDQIPEVVSTGAQYTVNNTPFTKVNYEEKYNEILNQPVPDTSPLGKETAAALTTIRGFISLANGGNLYNYYKAQERDVIQAAKNTAESLRSRGDVEVRNLLYQQEQIRGNNILKLAGKGVNLSGTNLDLVMMKRKQQELDTTTLMNNTSLQVANIERTGYVQAANVALQASARFGIDKLRIAGALLQGIDKYYSMDLAEKSADLRRYTQKRTYVDSMIAAREATKNLAGSMFRDEPETIGPKINSDDRVIGSLLNDSFSGVSLTTDSSFDSANKAINYIQFQ